MDDITAFPAFAAGTGSPLQPTFTGKRRDFFHLVRRGSVLELLTAGFYRFWLAQAMRRHLWFNTALDGDAFEYNGRARELLIGFLFALAILVPIYFVNFLIGIEIERYKYLGSLPLFLAFYVFWQFAAYRARRYRATRTVWRGARFWMGGSAWAYAWRAGVWGVLTFLTLGLLLPWREAALERYKMRNTYYGDAAGAFAGTGWQLFKRGWWLWLIMLLVAVLPLAGLSIIGIMDQFGSKVPPLPSAYRVSEATVGTLAFAWLGALLIAALVVYPAFKARVWRWWVEGIRVGGVWFKSSFRFRTIRGLYWKTGGWMLLIGVAEGILIATAIWTWRAATGETFGAFLQLPQIHPLIWFAATVGNYLVVILCMGLVMRIYLMRDLWVRLVTTTTVYNLASIENIAIKGAAADAIGEGLGDNFDVVGF